MKTSLFLLFTASLYFCCPLRAQPQKGDWELSMSGYFGSMKNIYKYSGPYGSEENEGEPLEYSLLAFRSGYFLGQQFELEPEILWTSQEYHPPAFALSANLIYNIKISNSKLLPFLLLGYGVANGVPVTQRLLERSSDDLDINFFNAGIGLRIFPVTSVAMRIEYRYQNYSREDSHGGYTFESTIIFHTVLIGFSVVL